MQFDSHRLSLARDLKRTNKTISLFAIPRLNRQQFYSLPKVDNVSMTKHFIFCTLSNWKLTKKRSTEVVCQMKMLNESTTQRFQNPVGSYSCL